ncbi:MAG: DUF4065 domain-containing protein [Chloroflexi bacterium]|nr:MAG: DUF4065 domain-containing protein [Chloroflexota bacterium]
MFPQYNEKKTTQIAAYLLQKAGGVMHYLKLLKLLYLLDRAALKVWREPLTNDKYYSMRHGPVLSNTYDRIRYRSPIDVDSYWYNCISEPKNYQVKLITPCSVSELSPAEIQLIDIIYRQFGDWDRWKLRDYCHTLPEYKQTTSSIPIDLKEILLAIGKNEDEINQIEIELKDQAYLDALFG